jgi:glyoxylase-like metal-dependent hydrolase (beta-lactamase superfamily II)
MEDIIIQQVVIGSFQVFTYLVACPKTKEAVIIDPAGEEDRIADMIEEMGMSVKFILNTHGHADHVLANEKLKAMLPGDQPVPVCMHEADDDFFSDAETRKQSERELGLPPPGPADIRLKDNQIIEVGTLKIQVLHTPGHTPGSVCYLINGNLFTGDTLFVGAAGRTDLAGGSLDTLLESLEKRLITLPGETVVWPGHDYGETPTSTISREMEENPYITDFLL